MNPEPLTNLGFHILLALSDGDMHGYGIIKDIEERSGGELTVRSGTLYTTLHRLEHRRLVARAGRKPKTAGGDERRRYYRITKDGRQAARFEAERLRQLLEVARERHLLMRG